MKKTFLFAVLAFVLLTNLTACNKKATNCIEAPASCFKGRLEIQDICGNYTIKVLEGNIDPSLFQSSWQHPTTKVTYQNVFSLGNSCSFPATIKAGDEFYFTIRSNKKETTCVQCLAYAPTPDKVLSINASSSPCNKTAD